ncbi:MAG: S9 family peptidase, partial [Planctomycetota bacterium]
MRTLLAALFIALSFPLVQAQQRGSADPTAGRDPTAGGDPYQWLEDVTAGESLEWARTRNATSTDELTGPAFDSMKDRLRAILDSDEKIPYVSKIGDHYYNLWTDADHPRGLWRRTTPAEYAEDDPEWETVIDVDALGAAEGES